MSDERKLVMVVDDGDVNRTILNEILSDCYDVVEFGSGVEAIEYLKKAEDGKAGKLPSAIMLDVMMPEMDGFETLAAIKTTKANGIPVLFITAENDDADETKALTEGAADFISKPFNPSVVKARVDSHVNLFNYATKMGEFVESKTRELVRTHENTLEKLLNIIEYRSLESGGHISRTRAYTRILVECMVDMPIFAEELKKLDPELIIKASVMHDVGKIGIPDNILLKPGRLNAEEFAAIKQHSAIGSDIVKSLDIGGNELYLKHCYDITRHHHERWDGTGYPDKLSGTDIPLSARIVALVDVYDALVSTRVYKTGYTLDETYAVIRSASGSQFQPDIVKALFESHAKFDKVRRESEESQ